MKGMVFTQFLDLVEERWGLAVLDRILLAAAPPSGGAYTAIGTYDWRELVALVEALAKATGIPVADLLRAYGDHLFAVFVRAYPQFFAGVDDAMDFLARVEAIIHPEVRKLYPDAELPRFLLCSSPAGMTLRYRSQRPFGDFAHGLIEGCLRHFRCDAVVTREPHGDGAVFHIAQPGGVPCPTR